MGVKVGVSHNKSREKITQLQFFLMFCGRPKVRQLEPDWYDTDRGLSDERAESDEVLATRDEVLRIVSHDLNNMLGSVLGMASLIEEDSDPAGGPSGTFAHARWITRAASG